jgi:hypothetical protein
MALSGRDVGRMAESLLLQWAAQSGFVANRAGVDATGWDYLVEFDRPAANGALPQSLDHEPPATASLVQVKGTDFGDSVDIKLDNMKRLIDWPIPAFVLVAVYESADDPKATYLVPVDEDLTHRVLKRLREVGDNKKDQLHHMNLSIRWEDAHRLPAHNGRALREAIEQHVGKNPARYAEQKISWNKTLGFGEHPYRARLVFSEKDPDEVERQMVSVGLGLAGRLDANIADLTETRFGITKPLKSPEQDTYIEIKSLPIAGKAKISMRSKKRVVAVNFDCSYYDPRILFPGIKSSNLRFRFTSDYVDLILHFGTGRWDFSFHLPALDVVVPLASVAKAVELLFMLENASDDELELGMSLNGSAVHRVGFEKGNLRFNTVDDPTVRPAYQAAADAWKVAQYIDLPNYTTIRLGHLTEHAAALHACRALIDPSVSPKFELSGTTPGALTGRLGYPVLGGGQIGDCVVLVGAVIGGVPVYTGETSEHGEKFTIKMPSIQVVLKDVIPVTGKGSISTALYYERLEDWMAQNGFDILPTTESLPGLDDAE